jgi:hypothetical protein
MAKRTSRRSSSTTVSVSQASSRAAEFNPDYSTVKSDLKRTGLLAGIFTVALIILSFIIP